MLNTESLLIDKYFLWKNVDNLAEYREALAVKKNDSFFILAAKKKLKRLNYV